MKKSISLLLAIIMLFSFVNVSVFAASIATPKVTSSNDVGGIKVYWNKIDKAVKYEVYRRVGGSNSWALVGTTTGTVIVDSGAINGKYYMYSVRAYNSQGSYSAYNKNMTYTTKCVSTPTLINIDNETNGLKLTWSAVSGASYRVYRRGAGSSNWLYLGTTSSTSYTDPKAVSGKYWRYTVRAVSSGYYSGFDTNGLYSMRLANPYSIKTSHGYDSFSYGIQGSSGYAGVNISWAKINGAKEYRIYRRSAGQSNWMCIGETDSTYFIDKSVLSNQYYRYTVKAKRDNIYSGFYSDGSVIKTTKITYSSGHECYEIYTANDLYKFANLVNSGQGYINAVLKNNINLNNRDWEPIGMEDTFWGVFDGNGYTISNINCNFVDSTAGLFGGSMGYIGNLTVTGTIKGGNSSGGIVGHGGGVISNCHNKCNVSGVESVGGIVGHNSCDMDSCSNSGTVTGKYYAGGIAGWSAGYINNCTNKGNINGDNNVGGIIGYNCDTIKKASNSGIVGGSYDVGGIAGDSSGSIENCVNKGSIKTNSNGGGIVGCSTGSVAVSTNNGSITGYETSCKLGGIVGYNLNEGVINSCTNTGTVAGYQSYCDIGGIVGDNSNDGTVNSCINKGIIGGYGILGGVVGSNSSTISNSYYYRNTAKKGIGYCYSHKNYGCTYHGVSAI